MTSQPTPTPSPSKPGIKTTEFWMTILVVMGSGVAHLYSEAEWAKVLALFIGSLTAMGYGAMRTNAKAASKPTP